jgi:predicted DNA-binding protein (UPF0251 family)
MKKTKRSPITQGLPTYGQPCNQEPAPAPKEPARKPGRPPTGAAAVEKAVLFLVTLQNLADVEAALVGKLGIPKHQVANIIAQARRKITLAADYARDEEIGKAITRLGDIYQRSIAMQDIKTALAAQREVSRLLGLLRKPPEEDGAGPEAERLRTIAGHLLPLRLADPSRPLEEHARLAAGAIRAARPHQLYTLGKGLTFSAPRPQHDPGKCPRQRRRRGGEGGRGDCQPGAVDVHQAGPPVDRPLDKG